VRVSGWGRHPVRDAEVLTPRSVADAAATLAGGAVTPRGLGRSYGDSSLGDRLVDTSGLDHLRSFDVEAGVVTCEAGMSLSTLLEVVVPRGWFLPVTPGTRWVSVGGAVASDVHGKNHHVAGSFSDHVDRLLVLTGDGEVVESSRTRHPDLFHATCGGMGLTGLVLEATIRLLPVRSRRIVERIDKAPDLDTAIDLFARHAGATYSVGWIDLVAQGRALGRSLVMTGEHAEDGDLSMDRPAPLGVPVDAPSPLLNRGTVKAFNTLYYGRVRAAVTEHLVDHEPFFYPLDRIADWNRLYGRRGLLQWQCVVPEAAGREPLREIVGRIAGSGLASPLAVLKVFGDGNDNHLSFPRRGTTLAVDLKVGPRALALCAELDDLVVAAGGRLYLTKDSRMTPETFRRTYDRIDEFEEVRRSWGAAGVFVSDQSRRLGLA
jgi:decaprenylphospho-beta-D-ribofuranose 2-oxidase